MSNVLRRSAELRSSAPSRDKARRVRPSARPAEKREQSPRRPVDAYTPPTALLAGIAATVLIAFAWSYWPTLAMMAETWSSEPDYSHGFLVPLISIGLLWFTRKSYPGFAPGIAWAGIALLSVGALLRFASAYYFIEDLDGWTILFWAAGLVWLLGGRDLFLWALPAIGFLMFMVPLPYRVEGWLSQPLQSVATRLSSWTLQLLGQPALAEGNVILMGDQKLFVEEACSGMRVFVGIVALAYALTIFFKSPLWEKMLLFASVPVVAILANSARIVITAITLYWLPEGAGEESRRAVHDLIGLLSIPFAAILFFWTVGFVRSAFPEEDVVDVSNYRQRQSAAT